MEQPYQSSFVVTWVISALVAAAVLAYLGVCLVGGTRTLGNLVVMGVVALFLPALLSTRPFLDKRALEKHTLYAITNFRVLAVVQEELMYVPLERDLQTDVEVQPDGCGHVCFGKAVGQPAEKHRTQAVTGIYGEDSHNERLGLLFYHVEKPKEILNYLR
jgi:hypothetical protein